MSEPITDDGHRGALLAELKSACGIYEDAVRNFDTALRQYLANSAVESERFRSATRARVIAARQYTKALRAFEQASGRLDEGAAQNEIAGEEGRTFVSLLSE